MGQALMGRAPQWLPWARKGLALMGQASIALLGPNGQAIIGRALMSHPWP